MLDNKSILIRYIQQLNQRHLSVLNELVAPSFRDDVLAGYHSNLAAFPDYQVEIIDLIAEGEKVVLWWRFQGAHLGMYSGIPPTGKNITGQAISIYTAVDGQITAAEGIRDELDILRQMGAA